MLLNDVHLHEQTEDTIIWKHANDGIYTAATAYKAQFLGLTLSPLDRMVWKAWAPPKVKFFAWLAIQDRIWTADRLQRRGWPNCGLCKLCNREQETGAHIFFKCRFTIRIWKSLIERIGLAHIDTSEWHTDESVYEWWDKRTDNRNPNQQALASLTILVSWTIWNERNARVF
uniref:Reverse transcriptase zinc-binding domain-containing protein n=1 Tax=Aegilops tauschii subsp. strangulata TaxID=200361 RepID=A0A453SE28_AEGTS